MNQITVERPSRDRKIIDRPLRLGTVIRLGRNLHITHRIMFSTKLRHLAHSNEKTANLSELLAYRITFPRAIPYSFQSNHGHFVFLNQQKSAAIHGLLPLRLLLRQRLTSALRQRARQARLQLDALSQRRARTQPLEAIHDRATRLDDLESRLKQAAKTLTSSARVALDTLAGQLDALSPLAVLSLGYSLTKRLSDGQVLRRAVDVQPGDQLSTLLADGEIISEVRSVHADE